MKDRYAALLSVTTSSRQRNREEATGTPADHPASDGPSIIVIRVSSVIVITLTGSVSNKSWTAPFRYSLTGPSPAAPEVSSLPPAG